MRDFFKSLFGPKPPVASAPPARPDRHAQASEPPKAEEPAAAPPAFVNRQAALGRNERTAGYIFSLDESLQSRFANQRAAARQVHDDLLVGALSAGAKLTSKRLAFVGLSPATIASARLNKLPVDNTVLLLEATAQDTSDALALKTIIDGARQRGHKLGWSIREKGATAHPAMALCEYIQIATSQFDGLELSALVDALRRQERAAGPKLLLSAYGLASFDEFQHCFRLGFNYFSGPFITRRENWRVPESEINRAHLIRLLNSLRGDAEGTELAHLLQQDAVLTYRFLRYINSAGMGFSSTITSLEQGLMILGRDRFYRWLSLLLFDFKNPGVSERSLTEQALVRARLMERLGSHCPPLAPSTDDLFLTGLFSLLDQILGQPIGEILARVTVGQTVRNALLESAGPYADLLALAIASEVGNRDELERRAALCGLDDATVNAELLESLNWVYDITEALA